jgi:hypothetical protein
MRVADPREQRRGLQKDATHTLFRGSRTRSEVPPKPGDSDSRKNEDPAVRLPLRWGSWPGRRPARHTAGRTRLGNVMCHISVGGPS